MRRAIVQLVAAAMVVYTAVVGGMYVNQRNMIYFPEPTRTEPARWGVGDMAEITVTTADDVTLTGWFRQPSVPDKPVILFLQGNAGHIGQRAFKVRRYLDEGYGVLMASYRGWGANVGSPSEHGLYADARAFLDYLETRGIRDDALVLYGESLGTGIAVQMATERPVGAIVLESPYTAVPDVALHRFPFIPAHLLVWDRFDSLSKIRRIGAPLLVLHGERDTIIPVDFGRRLFEAAPWPKRAYWLPQAGHRNMYDHGADQIVLTFLDSLGSLTAGLP